MHDLDRTLREFEAGMDEFESGDYEFEGGDYEFEGGYEGEFEGGYEGEFEGGYEGEFEGGYEGEFEGGYEGELEGDYEFESDQQSEFEADYEGGHEGEFEGDYEAGPEGELETVFDEVEEMELAAALLEITDERELEMFLGSLIRKAGEAVGQAFRTPGGKALIGVLKDVAKKALPVAGAALGNLGLPGLGGAAGAKIASAASQMFGLELEGMSPQDQEFETARRFVRLAGAAAQEVATNPGVGSPQDAAKDAVMQSAQQHAPGLARGGTWQSRVHAPYGFARRPGLRWGGGRAGRWIRRGRRIILYGV